MSMCVCVCVCVFHCYLSKKGPYPFSLPHFIFYKSGQKSPKQSLHCFFHSSFIHYISSCNVTALRSHIKTGLNILINPDQNFLFIPRAFIIWLIRPSRSTVKCFIRGVWGPQTVPNMLRGIMATAIRIFLSTDPFHSIISFSAYQICPGLFS